MDINEMTGWGNVSSIAAERKRHARQLLHLQNELNVVRGQLRGLERRKETQGELIVTLLAEQEGLFELIDAAYNHESNGTWDALQAEVNRIKALSDTRRQRCSVCGAPGHTAIGCGPSGQGSVLDRA